MATDKLNQQQFDLDIDALRPHLDDLFGVIQELGVLHATWSELTCGPRNENDVWAIDRVNERIRALKKERNALHKAIHETPVRGMK